MRAYGAVSILLPCFLMLPAAGCNDDDPTAPPDDDCAELKVLPFPTSPIQIVENFQSVFENLDYDRYLELLHPDFRMYLSPETVLEFGLPRNHFDYAEDIAITETMFSGIRPSPAVGAITGIDFTVLSQIDDWAQTGNSEFPGAIESQFDADICIFQEQPDGTTRLLNIKGRLVFFLSAEIIEWCGRTTTRYRLAGMIDETNIGVAKDTVPTQGLSWGSFKALYRPVQPLW